MRVTFAAFVEYKAPPDAGEAQPTAPVMTKDQLMVMFGGVRGVQVKLAKDDAVIRAAFPERFPSTGTDG